VRGYATGAYRFLTAVEGMKRLLKSGKKPMSRRCFAPSCTQTTPPTHWKLTGSWTPSPMLRVSSGSCKLRKRCSAKVRANRDDGNNALLMLPLGWQVGSDPEIQVATVVSNHLTAGIMKYFGDSGRCQQAANLFEKLMVKEPEVASLLARSYIGMSASSLVVPSIMAYNCYRRRSESGTNNRSSHERHTSIVHSSPRPMRFPALQGQIRLGVEVGTPGSQLRSERVRDLGEVDGHIP
jgi:ChAPs (Chs5p-Arf1p-binding proteins)